MQAPRYLTSAADPQANGIMWALAGRRNKGLYEIDLQDGRVLGSTSVSNAARAVAESADGTLGLALGTNRSGALELLDGRTMRAIRSVPLPAPARSVSVGSDGTTFYVLTSWATSASEEIVNSQTGKVRGAVPLPLDAVSAIPDVQQTLLYVLERNGLISEISIASGKVMSRFSIGHDRGRSLSLSPDGSTLYVLKGNRMVDNIGVVDVTTESMHRVLPAPSHCLQVLVSASGRQLYEITGTPRYGNIQVFAA